MAELGKQKFPEIEKKLLYSVYFSTMMFQVERALQHHCSMEKTASVILQKSSRMLRQGSRVSFALEAKDVKKHV